MFAEENAQHQLCWLYFGEESRPVTHLNHTDVICTVADGQRDGVRLVTNQVDKFGLLQR